MIYDWRKRGWVSICAVLTLVLTGCYSVNVSDRRPVLLERDMIGLDIKGLTACRRVVTNVSGLKPFSDFIGKPVRLEQAVTVRGMGWMKSHWRNADYKFSDSSDDGPILATLPKGHTVIIHKVCEERFIDGGPIIAYGTTTIPPSNKKVTFAQMWGYSNAILPAPWEKTGGSPVFRCRNKEGNYVVEKKL